MRLSAHRDKCALSARRVWYIRRVFFIPFFMQFVQDVKRVFGEKSQFLDGCEVTLYGTSALVVSGHKGLSALSSEQVVVRVKKGALVIVGSDLAVVKASPEEIYVSGVIRALSFCDPNGGVMF